MRREFRMVKADYRRTDRFDAPGHSTPVVAGARASSVEVVRAPLEGTTADELLREIERLYPQAADPAIVTQIAALARRYIALEGWTSVSPPLPLGGDTTRPRAAGARRFFRTASAVRHPRVSQGRPRSTRVW